MMELKLKKKHSLLNKKEKGREKKHYYIE